MALLEDKVVLVNGGSQGVGAGIVRAALREGATVAFTGRRAELGEKLAADTGATFVIITHNIPSVMRTADYVGVLYRSGLVRFASKDEMIEDDNPIIRQFLAGRAAGPIGMDELATEESEIEALLVERSSQRAIDQAEQRERERERDVLQV